MSDTNDHEMESTCYSELKWGNSAPPLDACKEDDPSPIIRSSTSTPDNGRGVSRAVKVDEKEPQNLDVNANANADNDNNNVLPPLRGEKTALLVVDVQPEYWSQCPAVRKDFPHFPSKLRATVEICRRQTVAKIIWVRADYRYSHSPWLKQFSRIHGLGDDNNHHNQNRKDEARRLHSIDNDDNDNGDKVTTVTPSFRAEVPCDPTSEEFQWEDFATPIGGEVLIPKSSWSSTSNTALMDILRAANVDTVLVCGLITSVCVQHSAFGVFEAGYRTILVTDACADRGKARHEAALALYGDYMYELITSDDLSCPSSRKGYLQKAKPLWALPAPMLSAAGGGGPMDTTAGYRAYSPVLSSQLPPPPRPSVSLSTSTSASSLGSLMSTTNIPTDQTSAIGAVVTSMRPLQMQ